MYIDQFGVSQVCLWSQKLRLRLRLLILKQKINFIYCISCCQSNTIFSIFICWLKWPRNQRNIFQHCLYYILVLCNTYHLVLHQKRKDLNDESLSSSRLYHPTTSPKRGALSGDGMPGYTKSLPSCYSKWFERNLYVVLHIINPHHSLNFIWPWTHILTWKLDVKLTFSQGLKICDERDHPLHFETETETFALWSQNLRLILIPFKSVSYFETDTETFSMWSQRLSPPWSQS